MDVEQTVQDVLVECLAVEPQEVHAEAHLYNVLGADSISMVSIEYQFRELGIDFLDGELNDALTDGCTHGSRPRGLGVRHMRGIESEIPQQSDAFEAALTRWGRTFPMTVGRLTQILRSKISPQAADARIA